MPKTGEPADAIASPPPHGSALRFLSDAVCSVPAQRGASGRSHAVTRRAFLGLVAGAAVAPLTLRLAAPEPVLGFTAGGCIGEPLWRHGRALHEAVSDAIVEGFVHAVQLGEVLGPFRGEVARAS